MGGYLAPSLGGRKTFLVGTRLSIRMIFYEKIFLTPTKISDDLLLVIN